MAERNFVDPYTGVEEIVNVPDRYAADPRVSEDWYRNVYHPYKDSGLQAAREDPTHPLAPISDGAFARGVYSGGQFWNGVQVALGFDNPENAAKDIARYQSWINQMPYSENTLNFLERVGEIHDEYGFWGEVGNYLELIATEPGSLTALKNVTLESAGMSLPVLAAGAATAWAAPAGLAGTAATMAVMGLGGGATEFGASVLEKLNDYVHQEWGTNISDDAAVTKVLSNKDLMAGFYDFALKRGVPIGALDAISVGLAGRFYAAVTGMGRVGRNAIKTTKAAKKAAKKAGKKAPPEHAKEAGALKKAAALATEALVIQPGLGGFGEYLGQTVAGQPRHYGDVITEAIAELLPGTLETGIGITLQKRKDNKIKRFKTLLEEEEASKKQAEEYEEREGITGESATVALQKIIGDKTGKSETAALDYFFDIGRPKASGFENYANIFLKKMLVDTKEPIKEGSPAIAFGSNYITSYLQNIGIKEEESAVHLGMVAESKQLFKRNQKGELVYSKEAENLANIVTQPEEKAAQRVHELAVPLATAFSIQKNKKVGGKIFDSVEHAKIMKHDINIVKIAGAKAAKKYQIYIDDKLLTTVENRTDAIDAALANIKDLRFDLGDLPDPDPTPAAGNLKIGNTYPFFTPDGERIDLKVSKVSAKDKITVINEKGKKEIVGDRLNTLSTNSIDSVLNNIEGNPIVGTLNTTELDKHAKYIKRKLEDLERKKEKIPNDLLRDNNAISNERIRRALQRYNALDEQSKAKKAATTIAGAEATVVEEAKAKAARVRGEGVRTQAEKEPFLPEITRVTVPVDEDNLIAIDDPDKLDTTQKMLLAMAQDRDAENKKKAMAGGIPVPPSPEEINRVIAGASETEWKVLPTHINPDFLVNAGIRVQKITGDLQRNSKWITDNQIVVPTDGSSMFVYIKPVYNHKLLGITVNKVLLDNEDFVDFLINEKKITDYGAKNIKELDALYTEYLEEYEFIEPKTKKHPPVVHEKFKKANPITKYVEKAMYSKGDNKESEAEISQRHTNVIAKEKSKQIKGKKWESPPLLALEYMTFKRDNKAAYDTRTRILRHIHDFQTYIMWTLADITKAKKVIPKLTTNRYNELTKTKEDFAGQILTRLTSDEIRQYYIKWQRMHEKRGIAQNTLRQQGQDVQGYLTFLQEKKEALTDPKVEFKLLDGTLIREDDIVFSFNPIKQHLIKERVAPNNPQTLTRSELAEITDIFNIDTENSFWALQPEFDEDGKFVDFQAKGARRQTKLNNLSEVLRLSTMFGFMGYDGLRLREVYQMSYDVAIDAIETGVIFIKRNTTKNGFGERPVPIAPHHKIMLENYVRYGRANDLINLENFLQHQLSLKQSQRVAGHKRITQEKIDKILTSASTFLFPSLDGSSHKLGYHIQPDHFAKQGNFWKGMEARSGVARDRSLPRALRRTFGSLAKDAGMTPIDLMQIMGHKDMAQTKHYAAGSIEFIEKTMKAQARMINEAYLNNEDVQTLGQRYQAQLTGVSLKGIKQALRVSEYEKRTKVVQPETGLYGILIGILNERPPGETASLKKQLDSRSDNELDAIDNPFINTETDGTIATSEGLSSGEQEQINGKELTKEAKKELTKRGKDETVTPETPIRKEVLDLNLNNILSLTADQIENLTPQEAIYLKDKLENGVRHEEWQNLEDINAAINKERLYDPDGNGSGGYGGGGQRGFSDIPNFGKPTGDGPNEYNPNLTHQLFTLTDSLKFIRRMLGGDMLLGKAARAQAELEWKARFPEGMTASDIAEGIWSWGRGLTMPTRMGEVYPVLKPSLTIADFIRRGRELTKSSLLSTPGVEDLLNLNMTQITHVGQAHLIIEEFSRFNRSDGTPYFKYYETPDGGAVINIPKEPAFEWETVQRNKETGEVLEGAALTAAKKAGIEIEEVTQDYLDAEGNRMEVYTNGMKDLRLGLSFLGKHKGAIIQPGQTITLSPEEWSGVKTSREVYKKGLFAHTAGAILNFTAGSPIMKSNLDGEGFLIEAPITEEDDLYTIKDKLFDSISGYLKYQIADIENYRAGIEEAIKNNETYTQATLDEDGYIETETQVPIKNLDDFIVQLQAAEAKIAGYREANKTIPAGVANELIQQLMEIAGQLNIIYGENSKIFESNKSQLGVEQLESEQRRLKSINDTRNNIEALRAAYDAFSYIKANPWYISHQRFGKAIYNVKVTLPDGTKQTLISETDDFQFGDILRRGPEKARLQERQNQIKDEMERLGYTDVEVSPVRDQTLNEIREFITDQDIPVLERLSRAYGHEDDPAVAQFIDEISNVAGSKGAGRFFMRRKKGSRGKRNGILGHATPDNIGNFAASQLTDYVRATSNSVPNNIFRKAKQAAVAEVHELNPVLGKYATDYFKYLSTPEDISGPIKSLTFHMTIGFNVSSALVNASQTLIVTAPLLKGIVGFGNPPLLVTNTLSKAFRDAINLSESPFKNLDTYGFNFNYNTMPEHLKGTTIEEEWNELKRQYNEGIIQSINNIEVGTDMKAQLSWIQRNMPGEWGIAFANVVKASAYMFGYIEQVNRITASLAAQRLARSSPEMYKKFETFTKNQTMYSTQEFSVDVAADMLVYKSQFMISKENRPQYFQNPVGAVMTQFMPYTINVLHLWAQALQMTMGRGATAKYMSAEQKAVNRKSGSILVGSLFVSTLLVGGGMGQPWGDNLKQIIKRATKAVNGYGYDLEDGMREVLADMGTGEAYIDVLMRGPLSRLTGIDVSKRMTVNEVIPYDLMAGDLTVAAGPTGAVFIDSIKRAMQAMSDFREGDRIKPAARFITSAMPIAFRNMIDASISMWDPHEPVRTTTGRVILPNEKLNKAQNLIRVVGFTPHTLRQERLRKQLISQLKMSASSKKNYYLSQYAKIGERKRRMYKEGNMKGYKAASKIMENLLKEIDELNKKAKAEGRPEHIIIMNQRTILNRLIGERYGMGSTQQARRTVGKLIRPRVTERAFKRKGY